MQPSSPLLALQNVSKRYGGVTRAARRRLCLRPRQIHAILGENGAGKSTLIKIMAGVVQPDEGRMIFEGKAAALRRTPRRRTAPASSASSRNSR